MADESPTTPRGSVLMPNGGVLQQNVMPDVSDTSNHTWRRIQVIPFIEQKSEPYSKPQSKPQSTPLQQLLILLKAIDEDSTQEDAYDKIIKNSTVSSLACDALIDNYGQNKYENHEILADNGFPVFPGERDRFGWLTGCIQTKKGIIVYG